MATPHQVSTKDFDNRVLRAAEPVVVDFWAEWCGPCHMMAPVLDQLAGELEGRMSFAKLNVDENPELSVRYGVEGIPTLIVFSQGKEAGRIVGFAPKPHLLHSVETNRLTGGQGGTRRLSHPPTRSARPVLGRRQPGTNLSMEAFMTTTAVSVTRPSITWRVLVPGLVASLVLGMWQMIVEAIVGAGLWSPPIYIAATLLRGLQGAGSTASFDLAGVGLGLMGHMMNSVILGLIFTFSIGPRLTSLGRQIAGGIVYGVVIFAAMWFVVLPLVNPVMLNLNAAAFFVGHMMWGAALGSANYLVVARA